MLCCVPQVPLQVRLQGVMISHNVVQSGVLWSRLVNTSMQDTDVMYNIGTGGRSSVVRQMHAVLAKLPAAVAEAGQRALANDSEPASLAAQVAAAGSIVPPGPCDVGSLQRSLLIMHGPSAFDMLRYVRWGCSMPLQGYKSCTGSAFAEAAVVNAGGAELS
jgi:hypothetical protein